MPETPSKIEEYGFDHSRLTKEALQDFLRKKGIQFGASLKKPALVLAVERFCVHACMRRGEMDQSYRTPGFDPKDLTIAKIRQILSLHGLQYTSTMTKEEAVQLFDDHAHLFTDETIDQNDVGTTVLPHAMDKQSEHDMEMEQEPIQVGNRTVRGMSRNVDTARAVSISPPTSYLVSDRGRSSQNNLGHVLDRSRSSPVNSNTTDTSNARASDFYFSPAPTVRRVAHSIVQRAAQISGFPSSPPPPPPPPPPSVLRRSASIAQSHHEPFIARLSNPRDALIARAVEFTLIKAVPLAQAGKIEDVLDLLEKEMGQVRTWIEAIKTNDDVDEEEL